MDIVVTWVDGSDPAWLEERARQLRATGLERRNRWNDGEQRYRDWGLLKYWFRGVERFAPWVDRIHFVTWGHVPAWLDRAHPRLNIVNHRDFIPEQYLPTFSSHTIELNLHRIKGLSDEFVYFNDDVFLVKPVGKARLFSKGLPCGAALLGPIKTIQNGIRAEINDVYVINAKFDKRRTLSRNWRKWYSARYGLKVFRNIYMLPFGYFPGFYIGHGPRPYLKSTFQKVWDENAEVLDETCSHRFRQTTDVNQWLMEYWQYASGTFTPARPLKGRIFEDGASYADFQADRIAGCEFVCVNDGADIADFARVRSQAESVLASILPEPCSFEKGAGR